MDPGFPRSGSPVPEVDLKNYYLDNFFPKNCMKLKEFGLEGTRSWRSSLDPPICGSVRSQCISCRVIWRAIFVNNNMLSERGCCDARTPGRNQFNTLLPYYLFTGREFLGRYTPSPHRDQAGTPPGTRYTPQDQLPPGTGTPLRAVRAISGRYASYWNEFLFNIY